MMNRLAVDDLKAGHMRHGGKSRGLRVDGTVDEIGGLMVVYIYICVCVCLCGPLSTSDPGCPIYSETTVAPPHTT